MKKNLRKIPPEILRKLKGIKSADIVAACSVKFKASALRNGVLKHLGLRLTPSGLLIISPVIPPAKQGRYSKINTDGEVIIRRDLPMDTSYTSVETPNWGDPYLGYHTVDLPHHSYKREFKPPRESELQVFSPITKPNLTTYVISFRVNEVLRKSSKEFRKRLLENLNLLQENVGASDVEAANTRVENYTKSLHLSWEILPPGTKKEAIQRLFKGRKASQQAKDVASDRYDFFMTLNPQKLVFGQSGFRRYFGALIKNDLVVFENIEYGNAVYIMFEKWQELSKKSRIDLLSGKFGKSFQRVQHLKGWKAQVEHIVRSKTDPAS